MTVTPILNPIEGERVVAIDPSIERFPESDMRHRLRPWNGRALTHTALVEEQRWRNGLASALGRAVAPGVVSGLEVSEIIDDDDITRLYIAPGVAVCTTGAVVTVNRAVEVRLDEIVVDRHDLPGGIDRGERYVRDLPTLEQVRGAAEPMPRAAILVLEPAYAPEYRDKPDDPCELDPSDYAFEKWQLIDSARLVLYAWPVDWLPLPPADAQRRNRLANAIFHRERQMRVSELHPWQRLGAPIALLGLDDQLDLAFVDRNAVMRLGGDAKPAFAPVEATGNRLLWEASFRQFNEQLASLAVIADQRTVAERAVADLRYLPSIGVLPTTFARLRPDDDSPDPTQLLFPPGFQISARPIPYEQLQLAIRQSLPLSPYDLQSPDYVELVVPVPQSVYDAELLTLARIDSAFDRTINRHTRSRNTLVGRQLDVRRKASVLNVAILATEREFPDIDLDDGIVNSPEILIPRDVDAIDTIEIPTPFVTDTVEVGRAWRIHADPVLPPDDWNTADFDDDQWRTAQSGFGFGAGGFTTELDDMRGRYDSISLRTRFSLSNEQASAKIVCSVVTDGTFEVFINGSAIDVPGASQLSRRGAVTRKFVIENVTPGINILAMRVTSRGLTTEKFVFVPRVVGVANLRSLPLPLVDEEDFGTELSLPEGNDAVFEPSYAVPDIADLKTRLVEFKLADDEIATLDTLGLEQFIAELEAKVGYANDKIDFGFVRLQTDIYRIRQFMLGTEATKLVTSPILATIAAGETANVTRTELSTFIQGLRSGERGADAPADAGNSESGGSRSRVPLRDTGDTFVAGGSRFAARSGQPFAAAGRSGFGARELDLGAGGGVRTRRSDTFSGGELRADLFRDRGSAIPDIEEQVPIVGATSQYHNVTVGERLKEPVATNAKTSSVATKAQVFGSFLEPGVINVRDIDVPGFRDAEGRETTVKFGDFGGTRLSEILSGQHDKNKEVDGAERSDEAAFFDSSVRAMENVAVVLRKMEGRVQSYRRAVKVCKKTLKTIQSNLKRADGRVTELALDLAEVRHDLSVGRALRDEEQERINELNRRRDEILANDVPFLLFRRPPFLDTHLELPGRTLLPAIGEGQLPECNIEDLDTPEEISAMLDLVRDAPLKWFVIAKDLLKILGRKSDLEAVLESSKGRSKRARPTHDRFFKQLAVEGVERDIATTFEATKRVIGGERERLISFDPLTFFRQGWRDMSRTVEEVSSLADVIDGSHGRMSANRMAAAELESIRSAVACLYARFSDLPNRLKLSWVERLSQFDRAVDLSDLNRLPRWSEVEILDRTEIQQLVDWLTGRVVSDYVEARDLINDLIRMALLLSSHAPVDKIVSGHVIEATDVEEGNEIQIAVPPRRVDIGMHVLIQTLGSTVAQAVVNNIEQDKIVARIVKTRGKKRVHIEKETTVQIRKTSRRRRSARRRGAVRKRTRTQISRRR